MNPLLLIDANAVACRVFYGGGDPYDAPDVISAVMPKPVADTVWCWDGERPYWRQVIHPEYKGTRTAHPAGFEPGLKRLWDRVGGIRVATFEADDVIATLARKHAGPVVIATTDKDLLQLCSDRVSVWRPGAVMWDADDPMTALGVRAEQVVDYLAMLGDSSDNVPGVPGFGKVKARRVLEAYGSLEFAIDCGALPAKYVASARLSLNLVRLHDDVPLVERAALGETDAK